MDKLTIHQRDGQTDKLTDTGREQRPRILLCRAVKTTTGNKLITWLVLSRTHCSRTALMRWLQLQFEFDFTAGRRPCDCLS